MQDLGGERRGNVAGRVVAERNKMIEIKRGREWAETGGEGIAHTGKLAHDYCGEMINSVSTNLMVTDMVTSLRFYHEVLGAELAFTVDAEQNTDMPGSIQDGVVFASIRAGTSEIMLQERTNLLEDSPAFDADTMPGSSTTMYFRVEDADTIVARLPKDTPVLKPLETTWYGMREIWIRDPDGYVLTIGHQDGAPPATAQS